jgi:flavodoxin
VDVPLIAFFSRAGQNYAGGAVVDLAVGNTEAAARILGRLTDGTLFRIEPVHPYPDQYHQATVVARDELRREARPPLARPAPAGPVPILLLGYPNWWGSFPRPVATFLESRSWAGTIVLPFCTHEGSGLGRSESELHRLCPGADLRPGLALTGTEAPRSDRLLAGWLEANGLA